MCRLDYLLLGKLPKKPSRQQVGCKLRLGVAGWHVDNQPLKLTLGYALEGFSHNLVVPATNKARPHHLDERHEVILRSGLVLCLLKLRQEFKELGLLLQREGADLVPQRGKILHDALLFGGRRRVWGAPACL